MEIHLPPSLRQRCDFNTLNLCAGSYVEPNLRNHCSDMLYSVRTNQGSGYIYCLVEHQSSPHKLMAYRMMRYSLAVMQQHLDQGYKDLPVVMPLLFYQGSRRGYPYTNDWLMCFSDVELARQVYHRPFPVIDLTIMSDEEIMTHRRVALLELVQKHIRLRDMTELVEKIGLLLALWPPSKDLQKSLVAYFAQVAKIEDVKLF
ncbi:Rpn family recombination-promoting nuclease/putative transposase [Acerihabitans sp. KWT182]|uniref:Rpn family recombination-promoting nuclease/putative transposase n=1 Tax=Acerihabitans sp. KWT182 TaxID=3157919 RepID=A0AAU7Q5C0_9GAMM